MISLNNLVASCHLNFLAFSKMLMVYWILGVLFTIDLLGVNKDILSVHDENLALEEVFINRPLNKIFLSCFDLIAAEDIFNLKILKKKIKLFHHELVAWMTEKQDVCFQLGYAVSGFKLHFVNSNIPQSLWGT